MRRRVLVLSAALLAGACAHGGGHHRPRDLATLTSNSDKLIFDTGQQALDKRQWDVARQHFRRIIDGFPQSQYGPAARLALGDSYYREGGTANYILAAPAYRDFLSLYPSHPKSDYAQFQVAECFFMQRNAPDRDQAPTKHALEEYEKLLETYPKSTYGDTARARVALLRYNLARSEFLAGYFYQHTRQACRSAIPRYQGILKDYPEFREVDEVLYRLSECLAAAGRPAEALPELDKLEKEHPTSPWIAEARTLKERVEHAPSPPPVPSPAPSPSPSPSASPSPKP